MLAALGKAQKYLTLLSFAQHLMVEARHHALLACKALVDEEVFLIMEHGVAEIGILHLPAVTLKLMDNYPMKVLIVHGIVRTKSCGIVIENDTVIGLVALG